MRRSRFTGRSKPNKTEFGWYFAGEPMDKRHSRGGRIRLVRYGPEMETCVHSRCPSPSPISEQPSCPRGNRCEVHPHEARSSSPSNTDSSGYEAARRYCERCHSIRRESRSPPQVEKVIAPATIDVNVTRMKHAQSRQAAVNTLALKQPQNAMVAVTQQGASVVPMRHVPPHRTVVIFQTTNHPEDAEAATAPESANQSTIRRWRYANVRPTHPLPAHLPFQARDTTPPVHRSRQHHAPAR